MNHITPIVHMTDKCNMACKYCYVGCANSTLLDYNNSDFNIQDKIPLLLNFIDQVICYNRKTPTKIIFHGGEPLLINPKCYAMIFNYIKRKNYSVEINFQTNGTLINDYYIKLFKEFNIQIGVSLDGPESVNDRTRVFRSGTGSFAKIFNNMKKLKASGLNFGCLLTLSRGNIDDIEEIYQFFKQNLIPYNIRQIFDTSYSYSKELLITPQEYATAYCKIFDMWFDDTEMDEILIDEFACIIAQFINPIEGLVSCNFTKDCSKHFISFDLDGKISPCNRLYGIPEFLHGNLKDESLLDILDKSNANNHSARWSILSTTDCKNCNVSDYCYGGCPANGYFYYNDYNHKDYYCESNKTIITHIYDKIKSTI